MWNDFLSWRRKIGVAMLFFACLCIGGRVRGLMALDIISLPSCYTIVSQRNMLHFMRTSEVEMRRVDETTGRTSVASFEMPRHKLVTSFSVTTTLSLLFGPNAAERDSLHLGLPYWALAQPASLLSAGLLLSKPRTPVLMSLRNR